MNHRYRIHVPGLLYVAFAALLGFAAMNSQNNLLFWMFGIMASALVISIVMCWLMMRSLRIRRMIPARGAVGEPLIIHYAVTNRSRLLPIFNVHIEECTGECRSWFTRLCSSVRNQFSGSMSNADGTSTHQPEINWPAYMPLARAWIMHTGSRETVHGEAVFWPHRRGEVRFEQIRIWTTFPFGLIRRTITITQTQSTLIHPRMYELRPRLLRSITPAGPLGMRISHRAGTGDDFYGLRDYRPGDSLRHIAWKCTAVRDELVSIEHTNPSPPKLRIVLDLRTETENIRVDDRELSPADTSAQAKAQFRHVLEERAISLAASILQLADRQGYEVGLSLAGTDRPPIAIRRNHWHLMKIMAALAAIDLDAPRLSSPMQRIPDDERCGQVIVHPDRADLTLGRVESWHLTARQLEKLMVQPLDHTETLSAAAATPTKLPRDAAA